MSVTLVNKELLKQIVTELLHFRLPAFQEAVIAMAYVRALPAPYVENSKRTELKAGFTGCLEFLCEYGFIEKIDIGGLNAYSLKAELAPEADELVCALDPFTYISHLSAMAWHGLTERIPRTLYLSRPDSQAWRNLGRSWQKTILKERADFYFDSSLPKLRVPDFTKVSGRMVSTWTSTRILFRVAHKKSSDQHIRVATVARCFLDMVREPELCGGIHHVIDTYISHAKPYAHLIIRELDEHGTKIEQARAGHLLEERLSIRADEFDRWASRAKRGGTRKLDPTADYSEKFSGRWALSLNV